METKSRYEVLSELENKKLALIMKKEELDSKLKQMKRSLRDRERELEDYKEEVEDFEKTIPQEKEKHDIMISSIEDSIKRFSDFGKGKSQS